MIDVWRLLVLTAACAACGARQQNTTVMPPRPDCVRAGCEQAPPCDGLRLSVVPTRDVAAVGEPVVLLLALTNCGQQPLDVPLFLEPEYLATQVSIRLPGERPTIYAPPLQRDTRRLLEKPLAGGESRGAVAHAYWQRPGWTMPQPGSYALVARLRAADRELESNRVTVTVRADAEGTAAPHEALLDEWGSALYFQKNPAATELIRRWPHLSVFTAFASTVGDIESGGGSSAVAGSAGGCAAHVPGLERAAGELPDAYFAAVALRYISHCIGEADSRFQIASRKYFVRHPVLGRHPAIAGMLRRGTAGK